jgi:hypothetical protein
MSALPKPKSAAGQNQTQRHDVYSRMRIEPEKILEKHGIAAIGFHEERLTRIAGYPRGFWSGALLCLEKGTIWGAPSPYGQIKSK